MKQIPTINLSTYSRKMLIDWYIIQLDMQDIKAHTAQLQRICVNINQIAKRINETGQIYADDMDEVKRVMEEVWILERRLQTGILRERLSVPYACYETINSDFKGKDGKGMERKRIIKNGHIVVKNPLAYELPKREVVIYSSHPCSTTCKTEKRHSRSYAVL